MVPRAFGEIISVFFPGVVIRLLEKVGGSLWFVLIPGGGLCG